jgi:hypothetical protein
LHYYCSGSVRDVLYDRARQTRLLQTVRYTDPHTVSFVPLLKGENKLTACYRLHFKPFTTGYNTTTARMHDKYN